MIRLLRVPWYIHVNSQTLGDQVTSHYEEDGNRRKDHYSGKWEEWYRNRLIDRTEVSSDTNQFSTAGIGGSSAG